MLITISGESVVEQRYVPWHIQEDQVSFTLELIEDEEDEISSTIAQFSDFHRINSCWNFSYWPCYTMDLQSIHEIRV